LVIIAQACLLLKIVKEGNCTGDLQKNASKNKQSKEEFIARGLTFLR
jgi:hypothetical protein